MSKILYVEDNIDTAQAVKIILEGIGHSVELAYTGEEGLKKLEMGDFDLVILDIMLPDMSGIDLFSKVKENTKSKYAFLSILPISKEKRKELEKDGMEDYISKPFSKKELIERINLILEKNERRSK